MTQGAASFRAGAVTSPVPSRLRSVTAMTKTYRAFLSYSHCDDRLARRIHVELENWRIDPGLIGRSSPVGAVPKTLRPIFRDREELSGGGSLSEAIRAALADSEFLIVLCSRDAAQSAHVNEEIRVFKSLGRGARIIPLIIAGEPGSADAECFPPALLQDFDADGNALGSAAEPLAADARESGDGHRQALAKVVAGLLGVPFDEIAQRAVQAARRRSRILFAVAAVMTLLALTAGGFAWLSESRRAVAERNYQAALGAADSLLDDVGMELIRVEGVELETTKGVIERASAIIDELSRSLPDAPELQISRVNALGVFAQALAAKGDNQGALLRYREAEALAARLLAARPDDPAREALLALVRTRLGAALAAGGERQAAIGSLEAGLSVLGRVEARIEASPDLQLEVANAEMMLALLLADQNGMTEAVAHGNRASTIAGDLSRRNPDDWRYRLLQVAARNAEAELLLKQGKRDAALGIYAEVEGRLIEAAGRKPDMPQIRTLLATVQASMASLYDEMGKAGEAEAARKRSAKTTSALVAGDAENLDARRQRADKLAEEAQALASRGAAMESAALFRESREALESMLESAPDDAQVRLSLQLSLARASDALAAAGLNAAAEVAARRLLELREQQFAAAPNDSQVARDLTFALHRLAGVLEQKGELEDGLGLRERQLALEERLGSDGRDNRALLADAHQAVGLLQWRLGRRAEALRHYEQYVALLTDLAIPEGADKTLRVRLGQGLLNLGELRVLGGDRAGALSAFTQCLELRRALVEAGFSSTERLIDLAWAQARLAQFGDAPALRWRQVEKLLTRADGIAPLGDLDEELLTTARIAISGNPL